MIGFWESDGIRTISPLALTLFAEGSTSDNPAPGYQSKEGSAAPHDYRTVKMVRSHS